MYIRKRFALIYWTSILDTYTYGFSVGSLKHCILVGTILVRMRIAHTFIYIGILLKKQIHKQSFMFSRYNCNTTYNIIWNDVSSTTTHDRCICSLSLHAVEVENMNRSRTSRRKKGQKFFIYIYISLYNSGKKLRNSGMFSIKIISFLAAAVVVCCWKTKFTYT